MIEDIFVLFVHDKKDVPKIWLKRWELSYPLSNSVEVSGDDSVENWQKAIQREVELVHDAKIMFVGHGAGANALASWFYSEAIELQGITKGAMLVSPLKKSWPDDPGHLLNRVYVNFPTAIITAKNDPESPGPWAKELARNMNARYIESPFENNLNDALKGWQWGMKVMQEIMLL